MKTATANHLSAKGKKQTTKAGIIILTLLIFSGGVSLVSLRLRDRIRTELMEREAAILSAVAQREASRDGQTILDLVLRVVDLDGVIGIRIFQPSGDFVRALPDNLISGTLDKRVLVDSRTTFRFMPRVHLFTLYADPFGDIGDQPLPILDVSLPIYEPVSKRLMGFTEFLVDGRMIEEAFRRLDRDLLRQALSAILGGGVLIAFILLRSLRQLEVKNHELAAANRALLLHAKTAAIGAVSSHLFHRLKNALASLHVAIRHNGSSLPDACASAQRIEEMVQEVINVIKEEDYGITYNLTAGEIQELVRERTQSLASAKGIRVATITSTLRSFANREANLLLLALENLVGNAIDASPHGDQVECTFHEDSVAARFGVADHGVGIPEARRARLFEPGESSKDGGSGIGLSISHQLCRHMGGELRLAHTGPDGTEFEITLPSTGLR